MDRLRELRTDEQIPEPFALEELWPAIIEEMANTGWSPSDLSAEGRDMLECVLPPLLHEMQERILAKLRREETLPLWQDFNQFRFETLPEILARLERLERAAV